MLGAGVEVGARYLFNERWGVEGAVGYERLIDDAADSPITAQGSADQYSPASASPAASASTSDPRRAQRPPVPRGATPADPLEISAKRELDVPAVAAGAAAVGHRMAQ